MSVYNPQVQEWAPSLQNMMVGVSIATFLLVPVFPPTILITPITMPQQGEIITTIPDGNIDPRILHYSTSQGLHTGALPTRLDEVEESENNNLAQMVREISGLNVDTLAGLVGVSRVAYHKWLVSGGIKLENVAQLTKLLNTFQTLRSLRIPDIRVFLESVGPAGKPLDLLTSGDVQAVIGLALRSSSPPKGPSTLSEQARQASGLPGWMRPAKRLNWNTPQLTDAEREEALDRLSPRPLPDEVIIVDHSDEDH